MPPEMNNGFATNVMPSSGLAPYALLPETAFGLEPLLQDPSSLHSASSGMMPLELTEIDQWNAIPPHGDTLNTATNIGWLIPVTDTTGTYDVTGFVSSGSDPDDFFRFTIGSTSSIDITLNGLVADADIELIRDANANGLIDPGEVIRGSYRGGSNAESIQVDGLGAGSYYVRVQAYGAAATAYTLNLAGVAELGTASEPNNTLSSATYLGNLNGPRTFSGFVGSTDPQDFYRFSLGTTTNVGVTLYGLSADADLEIIRDGNGNGLIDAGEVLKGSYNGSNTNDSVSLSGLGAGDYFVRVNRFGSANTNYTLYFAATPGAGMATGADNTLSGATNLGQLNGTRTYTGWVGNSDLNDFFRFSLGTSSNVTLSLAGMTADADLELIRDTNSNGVVDAGEVLHFSRNAGSLSESIDVRNLATGTYYVRVNPWGGANTDYTLTLRSLAPSVSSFAFDASGDGSSSSVFQGGALRFNYNLTSAEAVSNVRLEAVNSSGIVTSLGTWTSNSLSNGLINLSSFSTITAGTYDLRTIVRTTSGHEFIGDTQSLTVQGWTISGGTFQAETFTYNAGLGNGSVFLGRGGTDTLDLGIARSAISSINGLSLTSYNPLTNSTANQAIFQGSAFDYITLTDGREIYFQGIENLRFSDGTRFELQVRPNDTHFGRQWNLHVSDVDSAWRFTQGANNVLLASLDTGVLQLSTSDFTASRLITNATTDDNADSDHGHRAVSVMAATGNNTTGIAGINWTSPVHVSDVYGSGSTGVNLQSAIQQAITYARSQGMRVVFQGGIQGEYWLNSGGSEAQLRSLIAANSDVALFAIAAGNGGLDIDARPRDDSASYSGGVARLQTTHNNVIAVGALRPGSATNVWYQSGSGVTTINGLTNATSVSLASYSNRGSSLTLVAATDSPAMNQFGNMTYFGGTSAANPNLAGIASLVWSVNPTLTAGQVRQVMIDTAMDLGVAGRDNTFGHGLVNADAAVRRATALARQSDLASLYSGASVLA